jgi:ring-1,2-phenylacetyl-CoA epoxidase subunit PaaD
MNGNYTLINKENILSLLKLVNDPEIPVLSVMDLGIIRDVIVGVDGGIEVVITPTYSGCPAMNRIEWDIRATLLENGYPNNKITTVLSPAWTTDWMSEEGKKKLMTYGISPPNVKQSVCQVALFSAEEAIQCPHCHSYHTELISQFGSTACKALYKCLDCKEPFEYFKCH